MKTNRVARGELNGGGQKLTEGDVREIKRAIRRHASLASLARTYGVSTNLIQKIKNGRLWAHVKEDPNA